MSECLLANSSLAQCSGRGVSCVLSTDPVIFTCACTAGWTGFGDFNPVLDNCDVYIPAVYFLGGLVIFVAVSDLCIVYWALRQRTYAQLLDLLRKGNSTITITVCAIIVAVCQICWVSLRLSAVEMRVLGVDRAATVFFAISIFFIYANAPHVLSHYARLTFAEARVRMLDSVGREKATRRAKVARPLVVVILPVLSAIAGAGNLVSLGGPTFVKVGLYIMAVSTVVFLIFTLVLIAILIRPMVKDMVLAASMNRLNGSDQETLVNATRKLIVFQTIIVTVSLLYIPLMLVCSFVPELRGVVTYIYLLGAQFCGWICGLSVWTLTNVIAPKGLSPFRWSKKKNANQQELLISQNEGIAA